MPGSNSSLHDPAEYAPTALPSSGSVGSLVVDQRQFSRGGAGEPSISHSVERALDYFRSSTPLAFDQRRAERHAYPCAIDMWPVENGVPIEIPTIVIGKNLSLGGIAFFHRDPIPQRHAVVGLPWGGGSLVYLLTEIHWCRFLRAGWYDGGGRFLKIVDDPLTPAR